MRKKFLSYFFLLFTFLTIEAISGQSQSIIMGAETAYPPFSYLDDQGDITGFSIDLAKSVLEKMEISYSIDTGSWLKVKSDLEKNLIDLLPLVGRTPEREPYFDFTFPYLELNGTIFVHEDSPLPSGLADFTNRKIALMAGDNADEYVSARMPDGAIVRTRDFEQALILLSEKKIDAVVMQRLLGLELINKLNLDNLKTALDDLPGFKQSFCLAVNEGNKDLLAALNEGLSLVIADGTFDKLQFEWFSPLGSYRSSPRKILIGGNDDYPPYEFLDKNGKPTGFNVDLTMAIARYMDLDVEIILAPWTETYNRLLSGEIDLVQGLFYSPERDRQMEFSQAHSSVNHVALTRDEDSHINSYKALEGKSILVLKDDITHELLIRKGYKGDLIPVDSFSSLVIKLANGEGDCAIAARSPADYWIEKLNISNLETGTFSFISPQLNYGALEESSEFLNPFKEGLALLKGNGEYRKIYTKWFDSDENAGFDLALVAPPLGMLFLLVLLFLFHFKQTKKIKKRNSPGDEYQLCFITEQMESLLWILNLKGEILKTNRSFQKLFRNRITAIEGENIKEGPWSDFFSIIPFDHYDLINTKKTANLVDHRFMDGKGNIRWAHTEIAIHKNEEKGSHFIIGISTDLTRVKETEEKLNSSEEKFSIAVREAPAPIMIQTESGQILEVNRMWTELSGYSIHDIPTRKDWFEKAYGDGENMPSEYPQFIERLSSPFFDSGEYPITCANGEKRYWSFRSVTIGKNSSRENIHMTIAFDVTDKKKQLQHLVELEKGIEQSPLSIIITDYDGIILFANSKTSEISGYSHEELQGQHSRIFKSGLTDQKVYQDLWETIKDNRDWSGQLQNRNKKGELYWEQVIISPVTSEEGNIETFIASKEDISELMEKERKNALLEKQLKQKSQLDVIGQIAGGIAHDYNNMLNGILNSAHLLRSGRAGDGDKSDSYLDIITQAAERAIGLSKKLMAFSHKDEILFEKINLHFLIAETASRIKEDMESNVNLTVDLSARQFKVPGNSTEIHNALINICTNALQAMPEGGDLFIRTRNREVEESCKINSFPVEKGEYCTMEVEDRGCGIAPENLERIFEPFFTDWAKRKGSGLGLAAVYGTMLRHNGYIEVDSEFRKGTKIALSFKVLEERNMKRERGGKMIQKKAILKGTGSILVVDDEQMNRVVLPDLLETLGYKTIAASDGYEALEIYEKNREEIDLIILDFMMPGMNGTETFFKLRDFDPEVRVIIASGYSQNADIENMRENGLAGVLNKPYRAADLDAVLDHLKGDE